MNLSNLIASVYPNPTQDLIVIALNENVGKSFSMYDLNGKEVMHGSLSSKKTQISLEELNQGIYLLQLDFEENFCTKRIVTL